jgi:hypothetical protein
VRSSLLHASSTHLLLQIPASHADVLCSTSVRIVCCASSSRTSRLAHERIASVRPPPSPLVAALISTLPQARTHWAIFPCASQATPRKWRAALKRLRGALSFITCRYHASFPPHRLDRIPRSWTSFPPIAPEAAEEKAGWDYFRADNAAAKAAIYPGASSSIPGVGDFSWVDPPSLPRIPWLSSFGAGGASLQTPPGSLFSSGALEMRTEYHPVRPWSVSPYPRILY